MLTFHSRDECALMCSGDVSMVQWEREVKRIVQLIWNTFFIFAFFHSLVQRPLKWFSFMYVIIKEWREMCCYYKLSLECAHVACFFFFIRLIMDSSYIGSISLEHLCARSCLSNSCWWIICRLAVWNWRTRCWEQWKKVRNGTSRQNCVMINEEKAEGHHHYELQFFSQHMLALP